MEELYYKLTGSAPKLITDADISFYNTDKINEIMNNMAKLDPLTIKISIISIDYVDMSTVGEICFHPIEMSVNYTLYCNGKHYFDGVFKTDYYPDINIEKLSEQIKEAIINDLKLR